MPTAVSATPCAAIARSARCCATSSCAPSAQPPEPGCAAAARSPVRRSRPAPPRAGGGPENESIDRDTVRRRSAPTLRSRLRTRVQTRPGQGISVGAMALDAIVAPGLDGELAARLLDLTSDVAAAADRRGIVVQANPALVRAAGRDPSGLEALLLVHPEDRLRARAAARRVIDGEQG